MMDCERRVKGCFIVVTCLDVLVMVRETAWMFLVRIMRLSLVGYADNVKEGCLLSQGVCGVGREACLWHLSVIPVF